MFDSSEGTTADMTSWQSFTSGPFDNNPLSSCQAHARAHTHTHTHQVAPDAIHGTLAALGPKLDLLAAFKVPSHASLSAPAAPGHGLRAAVCYVGHHYLAFVLAEELGLWLCFDDADISLVRGWPAFLCTCVREKGGKGLEIGSK